MTDQSASPRQVWPAHIGVIRTAEHFVPRFTPPKWLPRRLQRAMIAVQHRLGLGHVTEVQIIQFVNAPLADSIATVLYEVET